MPIVKVPVTFNVQSLCNYTKFKDLNQEKNRKDLQCEKVHAHKQGGSVYTVISPDIITWENETLGK